MELCIHFREEATTGQFDPPFCRVSYDIDSAQFLRFGDQLDSYIVKFFKLFGECCRELDIGVVDQFGMRGQKSGTQDSIIPVENDTSLARLWFLFGLQPDFLLGDLI